MALNIFSAAFVSRSENNSSQRKHGRNAIAHAAYCRRETLTDERTGKKYDGLKMGKGQEAEWKDIFIPDHAPAWMRDPQKLWNRLEEREDESRRRDTALLSRSFIMTFPHELTSDQRIKMAKDFMREAARKNWVIDGAIHGPDGDNKNWHMHAQIPMRDIDENGFGKRRKIANSAKEKREELLSWKELWSGLGHRQLKRAGFLQEAERFKVGHLTLAQQRVHAIKRGDQEYADELDREPQVHMGPTAWAMEKKGVRTHQGAKLEAIKDRNNIRKRARERANKALEMGRGKAKPKVASKVAGKAEKALGSALDFISGALESVAAPKSPRELEEQIERDRILREEEPIRTKPDRSRDR